MINSDLFSISNAFVLGIANHLWQSTLFAVAAWLITIFLKKNHARIRCWIWFSVSIKFLVPFSIMVSLGALIAPEWMKAPVEISPKWDLIQTINQPFNPPEPEAVPPTLDIINAPSPSDKLPLILFSLCLCGSFAVLLTWHKQGVRISRMIRKAEPLLDNHTLETFNRIKRENRISHNVKLASTRDTMEPGVFGIFHPVLLLPAGILNHVNEYELETILLHEFAHIRNKDNLIAFIHMIVEALFWFHPALWWAGSRLVFERELACDESVLQAGKNPQAYAEGIIKVCDYYFKVPLACVSGVVGSDLKKRVEGIIKNQIGHDLSLIKKLFLSVAGLSVFGIPLSIGIINAQPGQAYYHNSEVYKFNVDENGPDSFQVSDKPERNNESTGIIISKDDKNISPAVNTVPVFVKGQNPPDDKAEGPDVAEQAPDYIRKSPDAMSTEAKKLSGKSVMGKNNSAVVTTHTKLKTPEIREKVIKSVKADRKTVLDTDAEARIMSVQNDSPAKVSSDAGNIRKTGSAGLKAKDADAYITRGISGLKKGQTEAAIFYFNQAIDLDPGKATAYIARGSAYFKLGHLDNAISDYNKALEINPDFAAACQKRGTAYYYRGMYKKAISDYDKAIELNPGNALNHYLRGNTNYKQGRFNDAISDYSKAIDINPEFTVAYQNRGTAYYLGGKYKKAISDYDKAIELAPRNAVNYHSRGTVYFAKKQYQKAFADFNSAIELDPDGYVGAYIDRGYYYQTVKRAYTKAADDYSKALEINPEVAVARMKLFRYPQGILTSKVRAAEQKLRESG